VSESSRLGEHERPLLDAEFIAFVAAAHGIRWQNIENLPPVTLTWDQWWDDSLSGLLEYCDPQSLAPDQYPSLTYEASASVWASLLLPTLSRGLRRRMIDRVNGDV
jgi:hypothetical protein